MINKYSAKPVKDYFKIKDAIKFLAVCGVLVWFMTVGAGKVDYNWQWYRIPKLFFTFADGSFVSGPLLKGLWITLEITAASLLISSIFGLVTTLFRLSDSFAARTPILAALRFLEFENIVAHHSLLCESPNRIYIYPN